MMMWSKKKALIICTALCCASETSARGETLSRLAANACMRRFVCAGAIRVDLPRLLSAPRITQSGRQSANLFLMKRAPQGSDIEGVEEVEFKNFDFFLFDK